MEDVIVIGGGPAGVTAALRARELGATVTLVERERLGGTCTNDGCAPTRVLAKAARLARDAGQFADYGLTAQPPQLDLAALMTRVQQTIYRLQEKKQLLSHLRQAGVTVLAEAGAARFLDPHRLGLPDGRQLEADKFILCAGGHARRLPFRGSGLALTHSDIWQLRHLPASVAIVGAAATGCQLASIFSDFGARVTLMEAAPRLLPAEDLDVSAAVGEAFERQGISILTGIEAVEQLAPDGLELRLDFRLAGRAHSLRAEAVVLAVGWPGNLEALNLPAAGVAVERGYVRVDEYLRTSAPHIFAAGDITGRMMLVQSAGYDGRQAAEGAVLGPSRAHRHLIVPHGGFTDPEYGSVGLTEAEARRSDPGCAVTLVRYQDLDRAVIDGHTTGFCKLIAAPDTRQVLGAHVVGEQAVEVVQLVAAGMTAGLRVEQLAEMELAYPTYTAIVGLAARRLAQELGAVSLAPQWRALHRLQPAEWEQSDL